MRIPDVLGSSMLKPEPKGRDHGKLGRHDGSLERMCVCGDMPQRSMQQNFIDTGFMCTTCY